MRLLAVVLAAALMALPGCLFPLLGLGCIGEARWREPGFFEWLEEHGNETGFSRGEAQAGMALETGPVIEAALPQGAVLTDATYRHQSGWSTDINVMLVSNATTVLGHASGRRFPSVDKVVDVMEGDIHPIYRGPPEAWDAALQQLRDGWAGSREDQYVSRMGLNLTGPWDLDSRFPRKAEFENGPGAYWAYAGDWEFWAVAPNWGTHWEVDMGFRTVSVDVADEVLYTAPGLRSSGAAKDFLRENVPYDWTFQRFRLAGCG